MQWSVLILIAVCGVLMGCSDPEEEAREQYMGLCRDYRQSCACQYDTLRQNLSDADYAELVGQLFKLADERGAAGGILPEIREMPGKPATRNAYFEAVLMCTRDAGF